MASNLRVDNILPSSGVNLGIGTANGSVTFIGDTDISTTGSVTIAGNLGVGGTITYEDVARVDATGISTFREGFGVGPLTGIALTAYKDGSIRTSGIVTAASFDGSLATSNLTGTISTATSAATAYALDSAANITTGIVTATAFIPSVGQLSHRNLIVNGAMTVAQRGSSFADPADNAYTLDRWKSRNSSGDPAFTWTKDSESPDGFACSLKCDCTTADTSLAAGDFHRLEYHFEGQDLQAFAKGTSSAKKGTLSFYVKTNKTGAYVVNFYDNDNGRGFSAAYTVANSNWNRYTISIPADTTGAWDNDKAGSLSVNWGLAIGSNRNSGSTGDLPTAWGSHASNKQFAGQVNFADSTSNDFYLTGVQLEVGSVATPFEHRSYNDELVQCERYYQTTYHGSTQDQPRMDLGFAASDTQVQSVHHYRTIMRNTPTPTQAGAFRVDGNTTKDVTSITFTYVCNVSCQVNYFTGAGLGGNNPYIIRGHSDADARLNFDAEL